MIEHDHQTEFLERTAELTQKLKELGIEILEDYFSIDASSVKLELEFRPNPLVKASLLKAAKVDFQKTEFIKKIISQSVLLGAYQTLRSIKIAKFNKDNLGLISDELEGLEDYPNWRIIDETIIEYLTHRFPLHISDVGPKDSLDVNKTLSAGGVKYKQADDLVFREGIY